MRLWISLGIVLLAVTTGVVSLQPMSFDVSRQLYELGYSTQYDWMVRRNSSGSRLYFYEWPKGRGILVVARGRVVGQLQRPAELAYLNDDEQFVAWTNDLRQGVEFANGARRSVGSSDSTVPFPGRFDVDPSGRYFVIGGGYGMKSEIGGIAQPMHTLAVSSLQPQRIFATGKRLYLLGWGPQGQGSLVCQFYEIASDRANLIYERTIKGSLEVLDMDPTSERLLVQEEGYLFPSQLVVDLRTGRETHFRFGDGSALFLQPGVTLDSK